jgi:Rrf2 family protein
VLTKTTETAIMALLYLALESDPKPVSPRQVAAALGVSPTYLAKTFTLLAKAGILQAHRGALGGVTLRHNPTEISLLNIVDACQGPLVGGSVLPPHAQQCDFNKAISGFEHSVMASLSGWTLARLARNSCPGNARGLAAPCRVANICPKRRRRRGGDPSRSVQRRRR